MKLSILGLESAPIHAARHRLGVVAEVRLETWDPCPSVVSGHALDLGGAEGVEAVHECDADVDLGGLAVGVP